LAKLEKANNLYLVSGASNHEIKIWNPKLSEKNELIATLLGHFAGI